MKVYTKTGDKGKTSLFSGERIPKSHKRVETYGEVDELNAFIGLIAADLTVEENNIRAELHTIQQTLFTMGSWLATTPEPAYTDRLTPLQQASVDNLEKAIDRMSDTLPELHEFILPGGSQAAATAHIARTVCRRVERHAIDLIQSETIAEKNIQDQMETILKYLNRLSDYFFVLARYLNMQQGREDITYTPAGNPK